MLIWKVPRLSSDPNPFLLYLNIQLVAHPKKKNIDHFLIKCLFMGSRHEINKYSLRVGEYGQTTITPARSFFFIKKFPSVKVKSQYVENFKNSQTNYYKQIASRYYIQKAYID